MLVCPILDVVLLEERERLVDVLHVVEEHPDGLYLAYGRLPLGYRGQGLGYGRHAHRQPFLVHAVEGQVGGREEAA